MGILNRRNAVVGWAVLKVGKRVAKKKARDVVPGGGDSNAPKRSAIAVALAGIGGALVFWRKRSGGDADSA